MKVIQNAGFTMDDIINADSATVTAKEVAGEVLVLTGILLANKDEDGELKKIAVMKTDKGLVATMSGNVLNTLDTLINAYTDNNMLDTLYAGVNVQINSTMGTHKREFLTLQKLA